MSLIGLRILLFDPPSRLHDHLNSKFDITLPPYRMIAAPSIQIQEYVDSESQEPVVCKVIIFLLGFY